jgi:transcriptional regulator with XRE-family HTH domain
LGIGDRIEEFRKANKDRFKTKKLLAEALNMSYESLYVYLENKVKPGSDFLAKLSLLGADINYILTGVVKMGEVKEPVIVYNAGGSIEERLSKLESDLEKVKARNYDLVEENRELWEAVKQLGCYNQVLTLLHNKANHHLSNAVDPPL